MQVHMTVGMALTSKTIVPEAEELCVKLNVREPLNLTTISGSVGSEDLFPTSFPRHFALQDIAPGKYALHLPGSGGRPAPFLLAWMTMKEVIARGWRADGIRIMQCLENCKEWHLHIKWTGGRLRHFWTTSTLFSYCTYETLAPD